MNKDKLLIILAVVGLAVGAYLLRTKGPTDSLGTPNLSNLTPVKLENAGSTPRPSVSPGSSVKSLPTSEYVVTYTDAGYSPSTLTIKKGDTVTWKNQSSSKMWTASAAHPTHVVYSGTSLLDHCPDTSNTSFDECKSAGPGESWSFTFQQSGTWGYHNHSHASHFGKVVVESNSAY